MRTGLVAVAIAVGAAAPAEGAITVGSDLGRQPDTPACVITLTQCTASIAGLSSATDAGGGATVPQPGVVTKWRIHLAGGATAQARFRVIRGTAGAGSSDAAMLPATPGIHEFATRLSVQTGDQIGVDMPALIPVIVGSAPPDLFDLWNPPLADGSSTPPSSDNGPGELTINADIEPDADGDGFGDESQDLCPTNAATQQACTAGAPETSFTKKPKKKSKKTKQTVEFTSNVAGATFQCSLDSVAFRACTSPLKLKGLKKGKHILLVRAVVNGIPDPTPAEARFTVKKKKKRRN